MGGYCLVCRSTVTLRRSAHLFGFPNKHKEFQRFEAWRKFAKLPVDFEANKYNRICDEHFNSDCYTSHLRNRLIWCAVPTIKSDDGNDGEEMLSDEGDDEDVERLEHPESVKMR